MGSNLPTIPDAGEREKALDPTRSFIVQAPAGSGKTELLMQRYLVLLAGVKRPEQVVAITFTRKAAGEMRSRVMEALESVRRKEASNEPHDIRRQELAKKVLQRDSLHGWNLLENPGRLKIQTIDSLCTSIVSHMPLLSSLGRQPEISNAPTGLYREAVRRTIAMVEDDGGAGKHIRTMLKHFDNSVMALGRSLMGMLEKRDQWLRHIEFNPDMDILRAILESSLRDAIEEALKKTREIFPAPLLERLTGPARYAGCNLLKEGKEGAITPLSDLTSPPGTSVADLPYWRGLSELLVTKGGSWRSARGLNRPIGFPPDRGKETAEQKRTLQNIIESLSENRAVLEGLIRIGQLPDPVYDAEELETLNALIHTLLTTDRQLMRVFDEMGVADFQAIAGGALEALGSDETPTDLMLAMDLRIEHILVDEYQDTSRNQLELLKSLTRGWEDGDGRTLFLVGDPMQSVYLFRDSEVGLFLDAKKGSLGAVSLDLLTLSANFRSQANVVDWVNDSFRSAFPCIEDAFTGSIRYEPLVAVHPPLEDLKVETRIFPGRNDDIEAMEIADIVKTIDPGETVAILVRSRPHLNAIIVEFKKREISFKTQEIDPLTSRPVIQDLLTLLRILIHPYDRIAWLALLRGPWCGMALQDILTLCVGESEKSVWVLMNDADRIYSLSEDGKVRLQSLLVQIRQALDKRGRRPLVEVLEGLWISLGGPACVSSDSLEEAGLFFKMVDGVCSGGDITSTEDLLGNLDGLYATHKDDETSRVEIMTIHKAKGLEFDHVILPGLGKRARPTGKRPLIWIERGDNLLLAPIERKVGGDGSQIYNYINGILMEKERLEQTRLLYVAATRAKRALYLFGHTTGKGENSHLKVEPRSLLATLMTSITPDSPMIANRPLPPDEGQENRRPSVLQLKRLHAAWTPPEPAKGITLKIEPAAIASTAPRPVFDMAGEATRHLGTVIHRYLCRIAKEGIEKWGVVRIRNEKEHISAALRQLGLKRTEADIAAERGIGILCGALEDKRGRWILGDHTAGSAELPLTAVIDNKIVHVVIDRTFVEGKVRWIIDYKTSGYEGGPLDGFLEEEKERYSGQLETYADILKLGGEIREIRKGLYYPSIPAWIEW